jgi:hypothetical protein
MCYVLLHTGFHVCGTNGIHICMLAACTRWVHEKFVQVVRLNFSAVCGEHYAGGGVMQALQGDAPKSRCMYNMVRKS